MFRTLWFRRWFSAPRRSARLSRSTRLHLEQLETREVPASSIFFTGANNIASFVGVGFQNNLVTGMDGNFANGQPDSNIHDFTAQVNWGDGSGWLPVVLAPDNPANPGNYLLKGSHVYNQVGTFSIEVEATGPGGDTGPVSINSATGAYMPSGLPGITPPAVTSPLAPTNVGLSMTGATNISSFTGVGFQENLFTGLNGALNGQNDPLASDFHAFVNYGDSSQWFAADVAANNSGENNPSFLVKGGHVYSQTGQYNIVVYAIGPDGTSLSEQINTVTVSNMPSGLPGTPPPAVTSPLAPTNVGMNMDGATNLSELAGVPFQNAVITGLNVSLNGQVENHASDLRAFINWGDSSQWSAATVVLNGNGGNNPGFLVEGGHVYNQSGDYPIVVYAIGPDGTTLSEEINSASVAANPNPTSTFVMSSPSLGVQRYMPTKGWQQLTTASARVIANDANGDVVGEFQGSGVYRFEDLSGWQRLTTANASLVTMDGAGDVFASFQGAGLYRYQTATGWQLLSTGYASAMAVDAAGDLAAAFSGAGVWLYTASSGHWQNLTSAAASQVAIDNSEDVAAEFQGAGVWRFTKLSANWSQLTAADAALVTMDPSGNVAAGFAGAGIYRYTTADGWQQVTPSTPALMVMDLAGDVYADFPGAGVYEYQPGIGWKLITSSDASCISAR